MNLRFINIPFTGGFHFEKNFDSRWATINSYPYKVVSVGHSWSYKTQIKGWQDWDFPNQTQNIMRDVAVFSIPKNDIIVTTIRNPFEILFDYYLNNWGRCKLHSKSETFEHFVDSYLNKDY